MRAGFDFIGLSEGYQIILNHLNQEIRRLHMFWLPFWCPDLLFNIVFCLFVCLFFLIKFEEKTDN